MPRPKSNKPKRGFLDGYRIYDPNDGLGRGSVSQWKTAWESMSGDEAEIIIGGDDPLAVLGFNSMPTADELGKRFRELMLKHHPDHGGDVKMAQRIIAAWTVLKEKTN